MNKISRRFGYGGGYAWSHPDQYKGDIPKSEAFPGLSKLLAGMLWGYTIYSASFGGKKELCSKLGNEKGLKETMISIAQKSSSLQKQISGSQQKLRKTFNDLKQDLQGGFFIPDDKFKDLKDYGKYIDDLYQNSLNFLKSIEGLKQETILSYKKEDLKKHCRGLGDTISIIDVTASENSTLARTNQSSERVVARVKNYIEKHKQKKVSSSINKEISSMKKNADKVSDNYYKDALMGLGDDSFMKAYYKGFSEEYNKKDEPPKRSYKDLMDVFKEEENIVLKSHPNSVFVADALNEGGLIENGLEQKEKIEKIVKKRPSGNFR